MNILITGSAGFLGQTLVPHLQALGHFIIGVDLNLDTLSNQFIQQDLREGIPHLKKEISVCIHLASYVGGILSNNRESGQEVYELSLLESVRQFFFQQSCSRILYTSSINVFENNPDYTHGPLTLLNQRSPYARAKAKGEEFIQKNFQSYGIIRPTNLFGKNQTTHKSDTIGSSHVIPELLKKIMQPTDELEVLGDGQQIRNFIHVSDVSRFLEIILEQPSRGWYNLRSNIHLSILELAQSLNKFKGTKKKIVFKPEYLEYEPIPIQMFDMAIPERTGWKALISNMVDGLNQ